MANLNLHGNISEKEKIYNIIKNDLIIDKNLNNCVPVSLILSFNGCST